MSDRTELNFIDGIIKINESVNPSMPVTVDSQRVLNTVLNEFNISLVNSYLSMPETKGKRALRRTVELHLEGTRRRRANEEGLKTTGNLRSGKLDYKVPAEKGFREFGKGITSISRQIFPSALLKMTGRYLLSDLLFNIAHKIASSAKENAAGRISLEDVKRALAITIQSEGLKNLAIVEGERIKEFTEKSKRIPTTGNKRWKIPEQKKAV